MNNVTQRRKVAKTQREDVGTRICASVFILALLLVFPASAQETDYNPFGVIEGFWLPDAACEIGAGWERIIFDWAQHQPNSPDEWYTLNVDDRWLEAAQACNREVVAVVKHTPQWATDGLLNAGLPRGLYLPVDDPENLWANFIRRAAEYYAPRGVNRFIIWNEPDIPAGAYGYEFEGTVEDYAQLLRVASLAAKEGNPDAKIHVAGTTYWYDVNNDQRLYVDRLLELLSADAEAAANGYYFDALTVHVYFRTDTVYQIARANHDVLERYGMSDKAVWIVETNASPNLDPAWRVDRPNWQISLEQQSAFLTQAAALGLAAGAERVAVYKFFDWNLPPGAESFGLIRADETRRPAFETWRMLTENFGDVTEASLAQTAAVDAVLLRHADSRETLVAWSRTAEPVEIQVGAGESAAELRDAFGAVYTMMPAYTNFTNGSPQGENADVSIYTNFTLILPGAVCNAVDGCAVGGQPVILTTVEPIASVNVGSEALSFVGG